MTDAEIQVLLRRMDARDAKDAEYHRRQDLEKAELRRDVKDMAKDVKALAERVDGALPRIEDLEDAKRDEETLAAYKAQEAKEAEKRQATRITFRQGLVILALTLAGTFGVYELVALHLISGEPSSVRNNNNTLVVTKK